MPQPNYRSDWLCISTSGQAVDGRIIESQWLIDAAETYSRDTYTALLWPHHPINELGEREFTCNLGEVDALKVETVGDVTKLYAQIIPNQFLIEANRMGQKLFTSAEFMSDFGGSGKDYLFGLAVTDIPASIGTSKIKFFHADEEKETERGSLEAFSLGKLTSQRADKKEPSFWSKLFSTGKTFTPEPDTNQPTEGEEKKMDELKALLQQLLELVRDGKTAAEGDAPDVDTPEQAADEVAAIAEQIADAAEEVAELAQDVAENPEDEVKAEEFSAAKVALARAMKAFNTKGTPKRVRRREFSARSRTKKADQNGELIKKLDDIMTKLSATESGTRRPDSAPAGSKPPFEFV